MSHLERDYQNKCFPITISIERKYNLEVDGKREEQTLLASYGVKKRSFFVMKCTVPVSVINWIAQLEKK